MSDAEQPELTDQEAHQRGANRGTMPLTTRIFGTIAVVLTTAVLVGSIYAVFDQEGKPLNGLNPQGPKAQTIQNLVLPVFIIASGQSGHPFSSHYDDLAVRWRRGEYITMSLDPDLARAAAAGITRLIPDQEAPAEPSP